MPGWFTSFFNGRLCRNGEIIEGDQLVVSDDTGLILHRTGYIGGDAVDLEDAIVAPGFLELHTNGMRGFHFSHFDEKTGVEAYKSKLDDAARHLPSQGVTGFWATLPTVPSADFQRILPILTPHEVEDGASFLGVHAEGPYLHPDKKGAHNASLFHQPSSSPIVEVYGNEATSPNGNLRLVTLAPELPGSSALIRDLTARGIRVSLGHTTANYDQGLNALGAGATCLTHTLNAMSPLQSRDPGLAGIIAARPPPGMESPYYSIIADGNHLHPAVATMLYRTNPDKCLLVTDSIELAGLPDGTYDGHAQIAQRQTKIGSRVVIEGTETLIGGCASLLDCVQNLMKWSGCNVAQAVKCVTENVADFMRDETRGRLTSGCRADLVVLDDEANLLQTWVAGRKVWEKK